MRTEAMKGEGRDYLISLRKEGSHRSRSIVRVASIAPGVRCKSGYCGLTHFRFLRLLIRSRCRLCLSFFYRTLRLNILMSYVILQAQPETDRKGYPSRSIEKRANRRPADRIYMDKIFKPPFYGGSYGAGPGELLIPFGLMKTHCCIGRLGRRAVGRQARFLVAPLGSGGR